MTFFQKYHLLFKILTVVIFVKISLVFFKFNINFKNIQVLSMISLFLLVSVGVYWAISEPTWDLWWFGEDFDEILISALLMGAITLGHFFKGFKKFAGFSILILWLSSITAKNLDFLFLTRHSSFIFYSSFICLVLPLLYLNMNRNTLIFKGEFISDYIFSRKFLRMASIKNTFLASDFFFYSLFLLLVLNITAPLLLGVTKTILVLPNLTYNSVFYLFWLFYLSFGLASYYMLLIINPHILLYLLTLAFGEFFHLLLIFQTAWVLNYYMADVCSFTLETILLHTSLPDYSSLNFFESTLDISNFCIVNYSIVYFLLLLFLLLLFL
jgi:hypothetical protein